EIIDTFKNTVSYEETEVDVKTREREIKGKLPVQKALSSLLGIYMPTSGCPILAKLSPMARFHLPFATVEETVFRSVSTYLLGQYFVMKEGGKPDLELKELKRIYEEIEKVNRSICQRLRNISEKDAHLNAVVILDNFAINLNFLFDKSLEQLRPIFEVYLKKD
ncbi:MAG TPA: hypothetical protein VJC03_01495, partial [bacterium]|nr:hypothetical protein [bacterium]